MNGYDLQAHVERFQAFSDAFLVENGDRSVLKHIRLKQQHSFLVLKAAEAILDRESDEGRGLDEHTRTLCLLGALYHDTGRFPQLRDYKTFRDSISCNHGLLGVRTIKGQGFLDGLKETDRRIVLAAVSMHNRPALPKGIDPGLAKISHLVRDADKLDIMRIMYGHFTDEDNDDPVVALHAKQDPDKYSEEVYGKVLAGQVPLYSEMTWANDFKLTLIAWVNDLHYPSSVALALSQAYLHGLAETLPDTPAIQELKQRYLDGGTRQAI